MAAALQSRKSNWQGRANVTLHPQAYDSSSGSYCDCHFTDSAKPMLGALELATLAVLFVLTTFTQ